ncbi:MAG: hypothetical protein IKG14_01785 [Clostridia bacterium]|nr:hypothetical protein [Clostridia bacterium]
MGFEEESLERLKGRAELYKEAYLRENGKKEDMKPGDRAYYEFNVENTTKNAVMRFHDRLNCGGYAFEIDNCFFPNGEKLSNYVSSVLDKFDFIRLLGDEPLHDDEYLVFYRIIDFEKNNGRNKGHHFVKVEQDGLVVEKNGAGRPLIFDKWHERYKESPEVVFAVKKDHNHYFDSRHSLTSFSGGLDFEQTVSKAIDEKNNSFSYHSHKYQLKKAQDGDAVVVDINGEIIADVLTDGVDTAVQITEGKEDYVENFSGPVKPIIKNGKLINLSEFKDKRDKSEIDR